jgi:hypothetical protein
MDKQKFPHYGRNHKLIHSNPLSYYWVVFWEPWRGVWNRGTNAEPFLTPSSYAIILNTTGLSCIQWRCYDPRMHRRKVLQSYILTVLRAVDYGDLTPMTTTLKYAIASDIRKRNNYSTSCTCFLSGWFALLILLLFVFSFLRSFFLSLPYFLYFSFSLYFCLLKIFF